MKFLGAILLIVAALTYSVEANGQSIDNAIKTAKADGKRVLIIFYSVSDSWSQKLDKEVLTYQAAIGEMANFVVVKIDGDSKSKIQYEGKDFTAKELTTKFSSTGYPSFVVIGSDGNPVSFKYDGEMTTSLSGYIDAEDFVKMLKYFAQNKEKDTDLSTVLGN